MTNLLIQEVNDSCLDKRNCKSGYCRAASDHHLTTDPQLLKVDVRVGPERIRILSKPAWGRGHEHTVALTRLELLELLTQMEGRP